MVKNFVFELVSSWVDYELSDLRCFGQGNFYPSQRATMEQVDRIMPIGSIIPWIPRLNSNCDNKATYHQTKGWIKCDGIETCDQGLFEGETCPSLADRGLIGANQNLKPAQLRDASIPQHNHSHKHIMNSHFHDSKYVGANAENVEQLTVSYYNSHKYPEYVPAYHNHNTRDQTKPVTSSMQTHSAPVTSVSGADIGENLPAHMRVDYLFKCY